MLWFDDSRFVLNFCCVCIVLCVIMFVLADIIINKKG